MFNHEGQLKIERAKLLYQVRLAEEKEAKAKEEEKKDSPESNSTGTRLFLPALGSADSDATAVNTPDRSVTPKSETETNSSAVSSDDNELTADVLRLRMEHLDKLLKFLETEFAPTRQKLTDLLVNGDIKFGLLWCLFRLGSVISFRDYESGLLMAGEVFNSSSNVNTDHERRLHATRRPTRIFRNPRALHRLQRVLLLLRLATIVLPPLTRLTSGKSLSSKISERSARYPHNHWTRNSKNNLNPAAQISSS